MVVVAEGRGLTVRDVARRYRVRKERVRAWIDRGELRAVNVGEPLGRARFVVMPEHLAEFDRKRAAGPEPKPARRKRRAAVVDYYPD